MALHSEPRVYLDIRGRPVELPASDNLPPSAYPLVELPSDGHGSKRYSNHPQTIRQAFETSQKRSAQVPSYFDVPPSRATWDLTHGWYRLKMKDGSNRLGLVCGWCRNAIHVADETTNVARCAASGDRKFDGNLNTALIEGV